MKKVYICSPYRAKDGAELDRNIDYAQQLTRQALEAGLAPITPHLYMTQCMDDKKPEERARGMAAGLALLKGCDFVIAGVKYGITEGMDREIHTANMLGIAVIDANQIKRHLEYEEKRQERAASDYAKLHLSLIHISEPTRRTPISYAVFCLKKKKKKKSMKKKKKQPN